MWGLIRGFRQMRHYFCSANVKHTWKVQGIRTGKIAQKVLGLGGRGDDFAVWYSKECIDDIKVWLFCVMILDIFAVVPLAGTWIEICYREWSWLGSVVVPLAGTWIEMQVYVLLVFPSFVVPLAGTWIEIIRHPMGWWLLRVVPLAGTWIEIRI